MVSKYINNPFNYNGSKFKLLQQIESNMSSSCKYMIEPLCGSGVVSINFGDRFDKVFANDACWQLISIIEWIKNTDIRLLLEIIDRTIECFELSKTNKHGYNMARQYYNMFQNKKETFNPALLYCLITHAFNYQIEFNLREEYNVPFGANRSSFNSSLRQKMIEYSQKIKTLNVELSSDLYGDFFDNMFAGEFPLSETWIYVDSPYLASSKSCYRIQGKRWSEHDEIKLYEYMDEIDALGGKFLLSNVIENNGHVNDILLTWMNKYNIIDIELSYRGCNYQRKNNGRTKEIMVRNY